MPVAGLFVFCFVRALIQFSVQRQVQRHGRDARQPAARSEGRSQVLELHVHQLGRLDLIENEVLFLFFWNGWGNSWTVSHSSEQRFETDGSFIISRPVGTFIWWCSRFNRLCFVTFGSWKLITADGLNSAANHSNCRAEAFSTPAPDHLSNGRGCHLLRC